MKWAYLKPGSSTCGSRDELAPRWEVATRGGVERKPAEPPTLDAPCNTDSLTVETERAFGRASGDER